MVLDGWEESERIRIKEGGMSMSWEDEREWGNDGLVTVQSAKWGEFLGIMEGCDRTFILLFPLEHFLIIQFS
jgi:triacylglycerol lipase